jgi:cytochrome c-type biogenesis protein CcmH
MSRSPSRRWTERLGWVAALGAVVIIGLGLMSPSTRAADRVEALGKQLRCPVCQTVSVEESPSETAQAMREIIAEQVAAGRTDEEVIAFFVDRYGEWIILEPPASGRTLVVWLLPPAALLAGLWVALKRKRRAGMAFGEGSSDEHSEIP